jgi:biopolymer transport protein ExbD
MKRMDSINVIPFIDIMLVLLAIVLATATFIAEGRLDIAVPAAAQQSPPLQRETFEIAIDRDGALFVDQHPIGLEALSSRLNALATDTPIRLRVDAAAEFGRFVAVIDRLKARGLDQVGITTRKP